MSNAIEVDVQVLLRRVCGAALTVFLALFIVGLELYAWQLPQSSGQGRLNIWFGLLWLATALGWAKAGVELWCASRPSKLLCSGVTVGLLALLAWLHLGYPVPRGQAWAWHQMATFAAVMGMIISGALGLPASIRRLLERA